MTAMEKAFESDIRNLEKEGPSHVWDTVNGDAEQRVNKAFEKVLQKIKSQPDKAFFQPDGTGKAAAIDALEESQRAWEIYHDAWIEFGLKRFPSTKRELWLNRVGSERIGQLTND